MASSRARLTFNPVSSFYAMLSCTLTRILHIFYTLFYDPFDFKGCYFRVFLIVRFILLLIISYFILTFYGHL